MENIWRWYISGKGIGMSGIVYAENEAESRIKIEEYMANQFDDFNQEQFDNAELYVWRVQDDDDFHSGYPDVIATNY